jgi:two-component system sensor histidine kinase KdpD
MNRTIKGSLTGAVVVALIVIGLSPFNQHLNSTTIALTLLLLILFIAAGYGSAPAFLTSIVAVLCLNFFFIPPYHTFRIADPQNWIALAAFLITSLIAGGLSARERRRAEEAEAGRKEIERLYSELNEAFQKASEAEAVKQSEQLKSALLDAVSHDLRTPLTSMKAAVTTLLVSNKDLDGKGQLDEDGRREMLEVIDSEIDRLNHLLEGLIEIAKIEAGSKEPRRTWSNLDEIVSLALARAAAITANHQVKVDLSEQLPALRVDEKALAEVFYVLIENATKYSPSNTEITIKAEKTVEGDGLKVSVEDRGVGIPLSLRGRVFDKFFRFSAPDSSARQRPAGLGMGLAIARALVEAHGGKIWIEDTSTGKGTRVSFTIPLNREPIALVQQ